MGLAVVDTHVPCPDVGPGLPTYALSMHILEEHSSVTSALAYLESVPRLGRNNLILADAEGQMAVFENSHHRSAVLEPEANCLVATNHFNSPAMKDCFVDINPPSLRGNTFERYQKVKDELTAAHGQIDLSLAQRLMASHDGPLASICRHPLPVSTSSTISTTVFLPAARQMLFRHGPPCQGTTIDTLVSLA
jgi:predicted choloylglycine hydrolase